MAENNIEICLATQKQVGAVTYKQNPSSGYMQIWGLSNADNYTTWTVTLPSSEVTSYMATALAYGNNPLENLKLSQVTATTMAGGMS